MRCSLDVVCEGTLARGSFRKVSQLLQEDQVQFRRSDQGSGDRIVQSTLAMCLRQLKDTTKDDVLFHPLLSVGTKYSMTGLRDIISSEDKTQVVVAAAKKNPGVALAVGPI